MDRFDVDYIDEEQGIKHIPCHDGDYVLAHEALATIEQLEVLYKICSGIHYSRIAMNTEGVKGGLAEMDAFFQREKDDE